LFRAADCDTDQYLVTANLGRDWQWTEFIWRGCLKKLNEVEGKELYHVEISYSFAALENSDTEMDINRAWETITENIKISAEESLGY
jgi:hypothetical protein